MDNLPVGTTYVSHIATGGTVNTFSGGQWAIGNINIGSSATLVIRARVTAPGTSSQTPIINVTTAAVGNESDPTSVGVDLTGVGQLMWLTMWWVRIVFFRWVSS